MTDAVEEQLRIQRLVVMHRLLQFDNIPDEDSIEHMEFRRLFRDLKVLTERIDDDLPDEIEGP